MSVAPQNRQMPRWLAYVLVARVAVVLDITAFVPVKLHLF